MPENLQYLILDSRGARDDVGNSSLEINVVHRRRLGKYRSQNITDGGKVFPRRLKLSVSLDIIPIWTIC
jgi:hypothetical protein